MSPTSHAVEAAKTALKQIASQHCGWIDPKGPPWRCPPPELVVKHAREIASQTLADLSLGAEGDGVSAQPAAEPAEAIERLREAVRRSKLSAPGGVAYSLAQDIGALLDSCDGWRHGYHQAVYLANLREGRAEKAEAKLAAIKPRDPCNYPADHAQHDQLTAVLERAEAAQQAGEVIAFRKGDAELILDAARRAADLECGFDLRWRADQRAIRRWQAAGPGRDLTWPDHADLVVWLLDGGRPLPADVAALVVAARIVAFEDQGPEALKALDVASEAFADRVRWDDEPDDIERCVACDIVFKAGDLVQADVDGGHLHDACCDDGIEGFVDADLEPLKPGDARPEPTVWAA